MNVLNFIKQHWWKILGVVLVGYALTFGLLRPLKPGILSNHPVTCHTDTLIGINISGYNTHYASGGPVRVWVKLSGEFSIRAVDIKVHSETSLTAFFQVPPFLPIPEQTGQCALVVDVPKDGFSVKPGALVIRQKDKNLDMGFAYWKKDPIEGLNEAQINSFPFRGILEETIRNIYYHVPMWFGMIILFGISLYHSIWFLRGRDSMGSEKSMALNIVGLVYGLLGLITGMIWARYTWGQYWSMDVKQNMAAIATLIYLAYFILRSAISDPDKRERVSAAYNIFAFAMLIPLLFIIPRMTDSLHPGSGGNPALGGEDLDHTMRQVFYPAVLGWTILGYWMATLIFRMRLIRNKIAEWTNANS